MDKVFDAKNLKHLRKLVKKTVGLELNDDDLYDCAVSVVRFTSAKILRSREYLSQEENNGGNARK